MQQVQFKTNINCGGCVARVTPFLNKAAGEQNWEVATQQKDKILTVTTSALSKEEIIAVVNEAGFKAEAI
ncbi:heavy-metal-associated domain-containing protein [Deminuibacter soli]|uniref:Copper chaperone n=1 Tax=Deminuibacter soli TaxID=2291815 RepID=A0A3E1NHL5_9BACT|nr:heavy-metal-associated domain-containing protein [Deminuibacter soli]RFM27440.1 copper chaperone [Deminuibacter soli]